MFKFNQIADNHWHVHAAVNGDHVGHFKISRKAQRRFGRVSNYYTFTPTKEYKARGMIARRSVDRKGCIGMMKSDYRQKVMKQFRTYPKED